MIPLSDPHIPRRTFPFITIGLLAINILVFLYQFTLGEVESFQFIYKFGVIPAELTGLPQLTQVPVEAEQRVLMLDLASPIPTWATIFTSMFMHGGFLHIIGNMVFLWVFGDNIEDRLGHVRYLVFYLAAGVVAALAQVWVSQDSYTPMIGASGAIAGVLGAYLVLYPSSRVNTLIWFGIVTVIPMPAVVLIGIWAVLQLFSGLGSLGPETAGGGVAYFAHLGGFVVGIAVALLVRLFFLTRGRGELR
jgi:membrane associated rhomboid family serine protease